MTNAFFASSRAAQYEKLLQKAVEWADFTKSTAIIGFCQENVWPQYVLEKQEAYEAIPDDLKQVFT